MCIGFQLLVLHQYARTLCVCVDFSDLLLCVPCSLRLPIAHISCTSMARYLNAFSTLCHFFCLSISFSRSFFISNVFRWTVLFYSKQNIFFSIRPFFAWQFRSLSNFFLSLLLLLLLSDRTNFLRLNSPNTMIDHGFGVLCVFQVTYFCTPTDDNNKQRKFFLSPRFCMSTVQHNVVKISQFIHWMLSYFRLVACCFYFSDQYNERN